MPLCCWCLSCILLPSETARGIPSIWNEVLVEAWFITRGATRVGDLCEWWSSCESNSASTSSHFEPRHTNPCHMWDSSQQLGRMSLNGNIYVSSIASTLLPWHAHWHLFQSKKVIRGQVRPKLVQYWSSLSRYQRIFVAFLPTERFASHLSMHVRGMKWWRSGKWTFSIIVLHHKSY